MADAIRVFPVSFISGQIEVAQDKSYVIDLAAVEAVTINSLVIQTSSGTCTAAININGSPVTGISAVSVTSTPSTANASAANTVAIGDTITLDLSSTSVARDVSFTLKYTRV